MERAPSRFDVVNSAYSITQGENDVGDIRAEGRAFFLGRVTRKT